MAEFNLPRALEDDFVRVDWRAGEPYEPGTYVDYAGKRYLVVAEFEYATLPPDVSPEYEFHREL